MAFRREWGTVPVASLQEHVRVQASQSSSSVDVVEPVAAAAELLPSAENLVRMCAVVDIGAGTTDIGLFLSLIPDSVSSVHTKLYRIGEPISVFKAGNLIDDIVLRIAQTRAKNSTALALADVRARIRGIKETLFRDGLVQELGCDIELKDLRAHPEARAMAKEIRAELVRLVQSNEKAVMDWMNKPVHAVHRLDVIMAGGGSGIDFVLSAIDAPIPIHQKLLPVKITIPGDRIGIRTFGASRGRLAVALGGASIEYEELLHEQPRVTTIRRGSI
jgi:molecular chaperone HscA